MGVLSLFGSFMAMQFEKAPEGYLYRAGGKGPGRPVTQEEFDRFVHKGGVSFLLHVLAFLLAVIAAAMLTAIWFPGGDEPGGFVLMGVMLLAIGFALYRSIHWAMLAPERALVDRKPVAVPKPGYYNRRRPRPVPSAPRPGAARNIGFFALIGWTLAELIGGIGAFVLVAEIIEWVTGANQAYFSAAMIGGLLAGGAVVFAMERRCRRKYGGGPLDLLSFPPHY